MFQWPAITTAQIAPSRPRLNSLPTKTRLVDASVPRAFPLVAIWLDPSHSLAKARLFLQFFLSAPVVTDTCSMMPSHGQYMYIIHYDMNLNNIYHAETLTLIRLATSSQEVSLSRNNLSRSSRGICDMERRPPTSSISSAVATPLSSTKYWIRKYNTEHGKNSCSILTKAKK